MIHMHEVATSFMQLERLPDGKRRIRLSRQTILREELQEGEQVMLIETGSLRVLAHIERVECQGDVHWYGVITGTLEDLDEITSQRAHF